MTNPAVIVRFPSVNNEGDLTTLAWRSVGATQRSRQGALIFLDCDHLNSDNMIRGSLQPDTSLRCTPGTAARMIGHPTLATIAED